VNTKLVTKTASEMRTLIGLDVGGVIRYEVGDGANAITASAALDRWLQIPFACTITKAVLTADASSSAVVDVWKDTDANFPPTVADTITASAKPTLSSASKASDSTLTGWTKTITAGDWIKFHIDSVSTAKTLALELTYTRT
jgi:hypothetical protein